MFIAPVTKTFQLSSRAWLASEDGTTATESITLDLALFTAAVHYPDGVLPASLALGKVTLTKLWGPYDGTKSNGQETLQGHLWNDIEVVTGITRYSDSLLTRGKVHLAKVFPAPPDAAGQADVKGFIRYL